MTNVVLIVTEKPSIARSMVKAFSVANKLKFTTIKGKSRFNPIFEAELTDVLEYTIHFSDTKSQTITLKPSDILRITSVTGHVSSFDYPPPFDKKTNWQISDPLELVALTPIEQPISQNIVDQLLELGKETTHLIIATDWDPQGESIGGQIERYVQNSKRAKKTRKKKKKSNLIVSRMRFTSTSIPSLIRAFETQYVLDKQLIASVDSLRQQDLRMGASLTRFLTVGTQDKGHSRLISYGPCQSSVLWIITQRYLKRQNFVPEPYWLLQAHAKITTMPQKKRKKGRKKKTKTKKAKKTEPTEESNLIIFDWVKNPITTESKLNELKAIFSESPSASFVNQKKEIQSIPRPKPLDTDTLESEGARLFRVSPKLVADIAEKLYNNGFITYPRTESSYYLQSDLTPECEKFLEHPDFQKDAQSCLTNGDPKNPSKGRYTKDHEPILPVKAVTEKEIAEAIKGTDFENNLAWRIYQYIVKRFFATIHTDGELEVITTQIEIQKELFQYTAQIITKQGFLEVYPYKIIREIPVITIPKKFDVEIHFEEQHTTPPDLWTESQLIREMARLNIGTDATRSQHIATVIDRGYAKVQPSTRALVPTDIGLAFYKTFTTFAEDLIHPKIRETVEKWTHNIRDGSMTPADVDAKVIKLTKDSLTTLKQKKEQIFPELSKAIRSATKEGETFGNCIKCIKSDLILKISAKGKRYLECTNDSCKQTYPVPKRGVLILLPEKCPACGMYPLQVGTGTKSWLFCPDCWVKRADEGGLMFCSRCEIETCPYSIINRNYSTKQEKGRLGQCPNCEEGEVILYFEEWKSIVECNNCQSEWKAPNIRAGTTIEVDGPCKLCNLSTLLIKRKGKKPYNMCPICSLLCFQCIHRCYG